MQDTDEGDPGFLSDLDSDMDTDNLACAILFIVVPQLLTFISLIIAS